MRALAVAGFAAGNVMLISIGIWAGEAGGLLLDPSARRHWRLLHWVSALIAMPAIAYAGRPFFASALAALRHRRTNMDVPISVGVLLVTGMSLVQTMQRRRPHLFRLRRHVVVLPAGRPGARSSSTRSGAGHGGTVAGTARDRCRRGAAGRHHRAARQQQVAAGDHVLVARRANWRRWRGGARDVDAGHQPGHRREPAGRRLRLARRSLPAR